ncbi:methyltransferase domain-containing protein [Pseudonocardia tropica]|uniref:Methyltransferase domain-containing protein n=1 Tax=Pseudonocardia tropica TaxID=681289 RepID=A0ABV1JXG2_9PSEU
MSLRDRRLNGYEGARPDVQQLVPPTASHVLELGCSSGRLGEALKLRQSVSVVGVEMDETYAADAVGRIDHVVNASAEEFVADPPPTARDFDCLIAADVLEHLVDPWTVLRSTVGLLAPGATVVISVPNILYWPQFRRLLFGHRFPRDDAGIFDRTHLRWFTKKDAEELAQSAGLRVERIVPSYWARGPRLLLRRTLAKTPVRSFMAAQYLVVATVPVGDAGAVPDDVV